MRAYNAVLKCIAFPPYSWQSIGKPPAPRPSLRMALCDWLRGIRPLPQFDRRRGAWAQLLLVMGCLLALGLVARLSALMAPTRVPPVLGAEVTLVLTFFAVMLLLAAYWMPDPLNLWPVDQPPSKRIFAHLTPPRDRSVVGRRLSRPVLAMFGATSIRRHIRSRLETLLVLYRAEIAACTSSVEEEATLARLGEQTLALRDSLPPKLTVLNMLALPALVVGTLFALGFLEKPSWTWYLSFFLLIFGMAAAGLTARIKHLVLELEVLPSDTQGPPASIYALEGRVCQSLGRLPPRGVRLDAWLELFAGILVIGSDVVVLTWRWAPFRPIPPWTKVFFGVLLLPLFYVFILEPIMDLRQRPYWEGRRFDGLPSSVPPN
jgi:hypothetical protein